MPRSPNIFHNLVTDENSTTELLCNLMRFSAFRRPLLARLFSDAISLQIGWDDIETQVELGDCGRPDLRVSNERVLALVEIKVSQYQGLTDNQPGGYFEFLAKDETPERWLVFLVPRTWIHLGALKASLEHLVNAPRGQMIQTRIVHWEDVIDVIEGNDLPALNSFVNDFCALLAARFLSGPIVFSTEEILMLFSRDIPAALSNLQSLIEGIRGKGSTYKSRPSRSRNLCPEEYGIYFTSTKDQDILWFGVWMDFWREQGMPLCFGVDDKWPLEVREAFRTTYKGKTRRFKNWTLGWIDQESLAGDSVLDGVWAQLAPVLEAVLQASSKGY
ncbi:MAG: hypothetical protein ACRD3A_09350 [Terriglobales bacterium]